MSNNSVLYLIKKLIQYFTFLLFVLLFSCNNKNKINSKLNYVEPDFSAKFFSIEKKTNYKLLKVFNPWVKNNIMASYCLYEDISRLKKIPENSIPIKIPVNKVVVLSATQIGMLNALQLGDKIVGVSNKNLIYDSIIRNRINKGEIVQLQDVNNLDIEKTITLKPDVVFVTAWNITNPKLERLRKAGIPYIIIAEWQETNPIGRASWMKFIASFFNQEAKADSILDRLAKSYTSLQILASQTIEKPTVLQGLLYQGTWYVPGGNSYTANLFKSANARYFWQNDTHTGSLSLNFESVYYKANKANFWTCGSTAKNLNQFVRENDRYTKFEAFKKGKIYSNAGRLNEDYMNDYWESGVSHPDVILKDLIKIFHPTLLKDYKLFYYKKI